MGSGKHKASLALISGQATGSQNRLASVAHFADRDPIKGNGWVIISVGTVRPRQNPAKTAELIRR